MQEILSIAITACLCPFGDGEGQHVATVKQDCRLRKVVLSGRFSRGYPLPWSTYYPNFFKALACGGLQKAFSKVGGQQ
jgi:hypothetical protein